ncbi:MAG: hypothetical protein ACYC4L_08890 [Chloroflexota bacterium]
MTQSSELGSVGRQEPTAVAQPTTPAGDPAPTTAGLVESEITEQATRSAAGVEQREHVVTDAAGLQHRARTVRDVGAEQRLNVRTGSQVVLLFFGVVEILIGLRIILKMIGANPDNDFASLVYNAAGLFLGPFFGLVGSPAAGGVVVEVPSLIAMLVYAMLGWLLITVVWPLFERPTTTSTSTYDRHER